MDAVKPGSWVTYADGAASLGISYGTFGARARRAQLRSRVEAGTLQVCLTAAFLDQYAPAAPQPAPAAVQSAPADEADTAVWLSDLAVYADGIAEDLAREAGEMNAAGEERAGAAGLSAAVVMGCLAHLMRVGAEMLSAPQEDASDVR